MLDALVINTTNSLDFQEIRQNVIRIPQVIQRIRQAQEIWDATAPRPFDLANFIGSDDVTFLSNIRLKSLAAAVVQVGLVDRFLTTRRLPQFLMGVSNGDSALGVMVGSVSFEQMVQNSPALSVVRPQAPLGLAAGAMPVLAGISLSEYAIYRHENARFSLVRDHEMDLRRLVRELCHDFAVRQIITVGPGDGVVSASVKEHLPQVLLSDSIELDPMLSWFWAQVGQQRSSAVQ